MALDATQEALLAGASALRNRAMRLDRAAGDDPYWLTKIEIWHEQAAILDELAKVDGVEKLARGWRVSA